MADDAAALFLLGIPDIPVVQSAGGLPLDIQSGAIVAYSQRALSKSWSSNLLTLRRASDNATQSFAPVSGAVSQSAINSFIGASTYQVISAEIINAGNGYDSGSPATIEMTVQGGTKTTAAVIEIVTDGSGHASFVNGITTAGNYTVLPTNPVVVTTGGGGSGMTLALQFGILSGGAFATSLADQSGNGYDAVQATSANQPAWLPGSFNGFPALLFDGSASYLATAGNTDWPANGYTFFVVVSVKGQWGYALGVNASAGAGGGPDLNVGPISNNQFDMSTDNAGFSSGAGGNINTITNPLTGQTTLNTALLFDVSTDPTTLVGFQNGRALTIGSFGYGNGQTGEVNKRLALGATDAISPGSFLGGQIVEIIGYNSVLGTTARNAIRQNIANYYGITLS